MDILFCGSIFLVVLKLFYRIIFFSNPFWYLNLFFFFFGIFLDYKFCIFPIIRENFVKIQKFLLGKSYWENPVVEFIYNDDNDDALNFKIISLSKIFHVNFFNSFYLNFCYFLILIRLFIFSRPYKFIFFKFILNYFLIFNDFFLLASLISLILIWSRLIIFISDFSLSKLKYSLNLIEKIDENEYFAVTWENAKTICLVVTRTFAEREAFLNVILKEIEEKTMEEEVSLTCYSCNLEKKYVQLFPEMKKHYLFSKNSNVFSFFLFEERINPIINKNKTYKEILKKKTYQSIFFRLKNCLEFIFFLPLSFSLFE